MFGKVALTHKEKRNKMAERQTENKVEAAGNNLLALTDDDGRLFVTKFVFSMKLFLFNWV